MDDFFLPVQEHLRLVLHPVVDGRRVGLNHARERHVRSGRDPE